MFRSILQASPHPNKSGFVIDLRAPADSNAQKGKGGGTEMIDHYFHWRHVHARMGNAAMFQENMLKMAEAFQGIDCENFFTKLDQASWLNDVRVLMSTAVVIARTLTREELPVVIHCSTGWDLTAQASSMAQILMDPYFRTYEGFQKLIEKEWLQGGHPFATRYGQFGPTSKPHMFRSPVFVMYGAIVLPLFPIFLPHFRLYEVVPFHMRVLPYQNRKILGMLSKPHMFRSPVS